MMEALILTNVLWAGVVVLLLRSSGSERRELYNRIQAPEVMTAQIGSEVQGSVAYLDERREAELEEN